MGPHFGYVFLTIYAAGALWLVASGCLSLYTKECTIWIGSKTYHLSGKKALIGGALTIIVGFALLFLAARQWRSLADLAASGG